MWSWPKRLTQLAERDCGWSWSAFAAPQSSSAWLSNCAKASTAKLDWTVTSLDPSPCQWRETGLCSDTDSVQHFFNIMFKQGIEDLDDDSAVYICYCLDSSLFNFWRLHTHTKTLEQVFRALLFTDDAALVPHTKRALQRLISCFIEAAQLFRLAVSLKMTEFLDQPASLEEYCPPYITFSGTELKEVHQFTYLGCTITLDIKMERKVDNILAKTNSAFGKLYKRVLNSNYLKKGCRTHHPAVQSWVTYRHHLWLLEHFHQCCLHTIFNIHCSNYVTNIDVLDQAEITSIEAMLLKSQLWWAGHVSRRGKMGLPAQDSPVWWTLHWPPWRRGTKKHFKDSLNKTHSICYINHHQWSTQNVHSQACRRTIHLVVSNFEDSCRANLRETPKKEDPGSLNSCAGILSAVTAAKLAYLASA